MIKREEVEALLNMTGEWPVIDIDSPTLAELARTWLAVDGAPVTLATEWIWENVPEELEGQLIKLVLVPEADSGGEG